MTSVVVREGDPFFAEVERVRGLAASTQPATPMRELETPVKSNGKHNYPKTRTPRRTTAELIALGLPSRAKKTAAKKTAAKKTAAKKTAAKKPTVKASVVQQLSDQGFIKKEATTYVPWPTGELLLTNEEETKETVTIYGPEVNGIRPVISRDVTTTTIQRYRVPE